MTKDNSRLHARRSVLALGLASVLPAIARGQSSDSYPNRTIRFVAGYPAGGAADTQARLLAVKLAEILGQPVLVDNRAGAAGNIGADAVAKAPADGYTLLLLASSVFAINPWLYHNLPFDVERDFTIVGQLASFQNVVLVPNGSPYQSIRDVIADARANPGKLSYGSPGTGTSAHLSAELLRSSTQTQMVHVPYKGDAPLLADLLGNQLPLGFANMAPSLSLLRSGKLRALGVTGASRSPNLPNVSTGEEQGFAGTAVTGWSGVAVRSGTPAPIVARLSNALREALNTDLRDKLLAQGADPTYSSAADFARFVTAERQRFGAVIKAAGISAD